MSDAGYSMLGAGARWWPGGMLWGGRWEGGSCLGAHVRPWWIHVKLWQNQYSIVKSNKVKIKILKIKKKVHVDTRCLSPFKLLIQSIINWVACKPQEFVSHSAEPEKILNQGASRFVVCWKASFLDGHLFPHMMEGAGKDWRQEEKRGQQRMRWLDGITNSMDMSCATLGDSERQRSLACCSPWGCKESDAA